jgi:hypothetical protein
MSAAPSTQYDLSASFAGEKLGCHKDLGFEPRRRRSEMQRYLGADVNGQSCTSAHCCSSVS